MNLKNINTSRRIGDTSLWETLVKTIGFSLEGIMFETIRQSVQYDTWFAIFILVWNEQDKVVGNVQKDVSGSMHTSFYKERFRVR